MELNEIFESLSSQEVLDAQWERFNKVVGFNECQITG